MGVLASQGRKQRGPWPCTIWWDRGGREDHGLVLSDGIARNMKVEQLVLTDYISRALRHPRMPQAHRQRLCGLQESRSHCWGPSVEQALVRQKAGQAPQCDNFLQIAFLKHGWLRDREKARSERGDGRETGREGPLYGKWEEFFSIVIFRDDEVHERCLKDWLCKAYCYNRNPNSYLENRKGSWPGMVT